MNSAVQTNPMAPRPEQRDCVTVKCLLAAACHGASATHHRRAHTQRRLNKGNLFFLEDDSNSSVYVICSGITALVAYSEPDSQTVVSVLVAGDAFRSDLCQGTPTALVGLGSNPAQFCCFPVRDLLELYDIDPRLGAACAGSLVHDHTALIGQLKVLGCPNIKDRIKILFRQLASRMDCTGQQVEFALTHEDLALLVGASRVTVTRALDSLEREGLLVRGVRTIQLEGGPPVLA